MWRNPNVLIGREIQITTALNYKNNKIMDNLLLELI